MRDKSKRIAITKDQFDILFKSLASKVDKNESPKTIRLKNKIIDFYVEFEPDHRDIEIINCEFKEEVLFTSGPKPAIVKKDRGGLLGMLRGQEDWFGLLDQTTSEYDSAVVIRYSEFDKHVQLDELTFNGKFISHDCEYKEVSFRNTVFNDLADFWRTVFTGRTIFYKTDFNATVVFSMATFKENVLFTYSLLAGKSIFAKTEFKKGLDLSQAIISGDLKFFEIEIPYWKFITKYISDKQKYQDAIDFLAIIPKSNKRETFRILKHYSHSIGDHVTAAKFKTYEYRTYFQTSLFEFITFKKFWNNLINVPMLTLNQISNNFGSNYWLGAGFTIFAAAMFTKFILEVNGGIEYTLDYNLWPLDTLVTLLNPVHKIADLKLCLSNEIYVLDFLSRISIGYGIYQTVQAFRKFK